MTAIIQWFSNLETTELILLIGSGLILAGGLGGWILAEEYKVRKLKKNNWNKKF